MDQEKDIHHYHLEERKIIKNKGGVIHHLLASDLISA